MEQQAHVHAVHRRGAQSLEVRRRSQKIRVGEPDGTLGQRADQLIESVQAGHIRVAGHDAQRDAPGLRRRLRRKLTIGNRRAEQRPHVSERRFQVGDRRPLDGHASIAPGGDPLGRIADPALAHAKTGHESDPAVHAQHLAVVAPQPSERAVDARRVEAAYFDAGGCQTLPKVSRGAAERAHPVVNQAHAHALAGLFHQRLGKLAPRFVFVNDVTFEMNGALRRRDGLQPGGIVLGSVLEQGQLVSGHQRRAGSSRECPRGKLPQWDQAVPVHLLLSQGGAHESRS
jgi:hypothetical protein